MNLDERMISIVELVREYDQERSKRERQNIIATLLEIIENKPIELPTQTLDEWEIEEFGVYGIWKKCKQ